MHILALSGSQRSASTNTALLHALALTSPATVRVQVYGGLAALPPFSPDREGPATPAPVLDFAQAIARADGLVISCPEYVHAMPGAFKNAIDWLVSREEIIAKPIALLHASHRGEDVLADLRRVLATVSSRFAPDIFARFPLNKRAPEAIAQHFATPQNAAPLRQFLADFTQFIRRSA